MIDRIPWKRLGRMAALAPLAPVSLLPVALAAQPAPAAHPGQLETFTFHHEQVLGTSLTLRLAASSPARARLAEAAALAEIDRQTAILSAWQPGSEFSRWARTRFQPLNVSPELMEVLAAFDLWRERTSGALDPSAEAAVQLWRRAAAEGRQPGQREIAETVEAIAQPHWSLDPRHGTATRLTDVPLALASFTKSLISQRAAKAALRNGADGVMLNIGGDIVVRGSLTESIGIADPARSAENDAPLDRIAVRNRAVATSGSYRRGLGPDASADSPLAAPQHSHIVDPRTARPTGHVLSATVIARDAATAGALSTAFSVLPVAESRALAAQTSGVEHLLVTADGRRIASPGWAAYRVPGVRPVTYLPAHAAPAAAPGMWNPAFELALGLQLPRPDDARYRRPYVAVWVEDADHFPVRTLALWTQNPRWLPELKQWYRDDQLRNLAEGTDVSKTISSATRPPGQYSLKWDGRDNEGKPVRAGKYTVVFEASREHGGYQVERHEMNFDAEPQQAALPAGKELGAVTLDYRRR